MKLQRNTILVVAAIAGVLIITGIVLALPPREENPILDLSDDDTTGIVLFNEEQANEVVQVLMDTGAFINVGYYAVTETDGPAGEMYEITGDPMQSGAWYTKNTVFIELAFDSAYLDYMGYIARNHLLIIPAATVIHSPTAPDYYQDVTGVAIAWNSFDEIVLFDAAELDIDMVEAQDTFTVHVL